MSNIYEAKPKLRPETQEVNDSLIKEGQYILEMLVAKNAHYDNAALTPIGVFAQMNALDTIRVRIDDKLARLKHFAQRGLDDASEDTIADLIGYLLLYRVGLQRRRMRDATQSMDNSSAYDPMNELHSRIAILEDIVRERSRDEVKEPLEVHVVNETPVVASKGRKRPGPKPGWKKTPARTATRRKKAKR